MPWSRIAHLVLMLGCTACAARPVHVQYVQAQPVMAPPAAPPSPPVVAMAGGPLAPGDVPRRPQLQRVPTETAPEPVRPSYQVIDTANQAAAREPEAEQFFNAVQSWPFEAGARYRVYTAPFYVTDVALRPGEQIEGQLASGDMMRWVVRVGTSSANGVQQQHVYIKPSRAGLQTNLVIQTNQARTYFIELYSFKETHMVGASWTYPREEFAEQLAQKNATELAAKQLTPLAATSFADVNCEYAIKTIAGNPAWKPRTGGVCDDGNKTIIRFPYAMAGREAPVLFLLRGGNTHMVNYIPQGQMYVINRLIDGAELRLGQDDEAEIVRIARKGKRN